MMFYLVNFLTLIRVVLDEILSMVKLEFIDFSYEF